MTSAIAPGAPGFARAMAFWFRLGLISFGGPAGQIALMHEELVDRRRWISEPRFLHALNFCMVLPGPEALQLAIYLGWLFHRRLGGLLAGLLFILPSFLLLVLLSWLYVRFGAIAWVAAVFHGVKPAVVAVVCQACLRIGGRVLRSRLLWATAIASLLALALADAPFPLLIGVAALVGAAASRWAPAALGRASGAHAARPAIARGPALIDEDTPPPAHARAHPISSSLVLACGGVLWALPYFALQSLLGPAHVLSRMATLFSKAALLTFGGAYAVLPYVFHAAVLDEHWLSAGQMMDGLALGESTPGPLIIVVTFVGFVGAFLRAAGDGGLWAGLAGAAVVTWFTFLPSFVMVLAGAPLVETSRRHWPLTGPLTAISAAVCGVIVHLALLFAWGVFWPASADGRPDPGAIAITLLALYLLLARRQSVIRVIACSALAGLALAGPSLLSGVPS